MTIVKNTLAALAGASFLIAQPAAAAAAAPIQRTGATQGAAEGQAEGLNVVVIVGVFLGLLLLAEVTEVIDVFGDENPRSP
jgi:hypothetical protein